MLPILVITLKLKDYDNFQQDFKREQQHYNTPKD